MAAADRARARGNVLVLAGALAILVGLALLAYGLAPAAAFADIFATAFSGGPPPEDLAQHIDGAMAGLAARVWVDAAGFLALMAGIGLVKGGLRKPAPKPLEVLVQEEVERRMQGLASTAVVAPSQPTPAAPAVVPAPPVARAGGRCTACGSILVAKGRLCPQGHVQG